MTCQHRHIGFGSGDYYIFCRQCSKQWAIVGNQPEYGTSASGESIGANPLLASSEGNPEDIVDNATLRARLAAAEKVVEHMQEFIRAVDNDALEMNSPEIGEPESDIPMHPWHEEWLYHAREALTAYQEHSDGR